MTNNKSPRIVGIMGKKYNGKDTIADYLCARYGYIKLSYAQPLKDICKILFNFTDEQLYGKQKETIDERWGTSPRKLFQFIGTDLLRNQLATIIPEIGNNIWIRCVEEKINSLIKENPDTLIVISDVRFQNEIDIIKDKYKDSMIIKVTRNFDDNSTTTTHESESIDLLTGFDTEIHNNSDLKTLYKKVDNLFINNA